MQTAEVDTSELYTGYCLGICFWPPQAGHMYAGLKGQDIVAYLGAAASKRVEYLVWIVLVRFSI